MQLLISHQKEIKEKEKLIQVIQKDQVEFKGASDSGSKSQQ